MDRPVRVGIVLGSDSDFDVMLEAVKVLDALEIGCEVVVASAHRTPKRTEEYATSAAGKGIVFGQHHLLAGPEQSWEWVKVGGGTPPVRVRDGWLVLYHGVSGRIVPGVDQQQGVRYCAGMLLLDAQDPRQVCYRSAQSILAPRMEEECEGVVPHVVFPTGVDTWADGTLDVYYGMADSRIGVARSCVAALSGPAPAQADYAPARAA